MFPDANQLAQMRADGTELLQDRCTIQQAARVSDGASGFTTGWTTVGTNVPCLIEPLKGGDDPSRGLNAKESLYTALFSWNASLTADCQILHGSDTYEVWDLAKDQSAIVFREAILKKVDPAP